MGAIIEACHDDKGIIWPVAVAPFQLGMVNVKPADAETSAVAESLIVQATNAGIEVLYDDRDQRAGVKFAEMELLGIPWRVVVSPKAVAAGRFEVTERRSGQTHEIAAENIVPFLLGPQ